MFKKIITVFVISFLIIPLNVFAYSDYVIAGGNNIGIELKSKGVIIVGFYKVNNDYIASDAGLEIGDRITSINNEPVNSIIDLSYLIKKSNGEIKVDFIRNNNLKTTWLKLVNENNTYKTGLYVKDTITGIGTLTYIDPNTKIFGALGHEIVDSKTGRIFDANNGNIYKSNVTDIIKSQRGLPGEKNAKILKDKLDGNVKENTNKGIFGNYLTDINQNKLYKVAKPEEIKKEKAYILTVLNNDEISKYEIEITKLNLDKDTKNILFKIVDENLLNKTNGIVQGMSGSPIIQDDKIIGAVTHVIVDNPQKGYGIFITNMLEEGEN